MTTVNLEMVRGDTEQFKVTISRDSALVDLTGAKIWMSARRHHTSPALFTKSSDPGGGIEITTPLGGEALITLAVEDTAGLSSEVMELVYDVQVRTAAGIVFTPINGTLTVKPDVTTVTE